MEEIPIRIKHMRGRATCGCLWLSGLDPVGVFREDLSHSPGLLFQGLTSLTPGTVRVRPFSGHLRASDSQNPKHKAGGQRSFEGEPKPVLTLAVT